MKSIHILAFASIIFISGSIGCYSSDRKTKVTSGKSAPAKQAAEVHWLHSMDQGKTLAKQSGKPMMVDFYAEWCGWCKKLDSEVYTKPAVVQLSEKFVNVKVDVDKNGKDAKTFGVRGLPTIVFLKPDGTVLQQISGYRDSAEFVRVMTEVLSNAGSR